MSTHIPLDIELEIMKMLPVKSLIRFMSVCKAWKSFIRCSKFISGYSFYHTKLQHLMISYEVGDGKETDRKVKYVSFMDDDTSPLQKLPLTVPPLVQGTKLIGSSHGLLCLTGSFRQPLTKKMVVLWNPAIRKSIAVEVPNPVHRPFDSFLGFGVVPNTKDPKLVKITYIDNYNKMESICRIPFQVIIFTLSSGEWRCLRNNRLPRKSIQSGDCLQIVVGQFIYWLAWDTNNGDGLGDYLLMSFDLNTDEFTEVDVPDNLRRSILNISKLRESLVLLNYGISFTTQKIFCDVWMMEHGDSKTFTKIFTINSKWGIMGFRNSGEPIVKMKDGNQDFHTPCALVVYEACLEDTKDLGICGNDHSFSVKSYTESLLLLDHDDHCQIVCSIDVNR